MSTEVQSVVKVQSALDTSDREKKSVHLTSGLNKKQKQDDTRIKSRKRSQSFSGKLFPPYKKRKKDKLILPTKFLLGGNIRDPLNLNSFQDEEVNRAMNAVTPESSPLPTPQHKKGEIEVLIPADIRDPLSLAAEVEDDDAYVASLMTTTAKRVKKNKKKKKHRSSAGSGKEDNNDIKSDESKGEEIIEAELKTEPPETTTPIEIEELPVEETKPELVEEDDINKKEQLSTMPIAQIDNTPIITTSTITESTITATATTTPATTVIVQPAAKRPCNLGPVPSSGILISSLQLVQNTSGSPVTNTTAIGNQIGSNNSANNATKLQRKFDKDKIVSPVVPQPGAWLDRHHHVRFRKQSAPGVGPSITGTNRQVPKFKEANKKFQYGNYHRYYGYRNVNEEDARLRLICQRLGLNFFQDKDVLDIGCNSGLLTLAVARDLGAKHVVGMDIDKTLINTAKTSLTRYSQTMKKESDGFKQGQIFPLSMPVIYGSLNVPGVKDSPFPRNITFVQGNYVLDDDVLLDIEQPQFDIILCLSVTKWLHLNWGDNGLKRAFKRMFTQLRPGGVLILEPQSWTSYKKKKNLTETTWKHYQNIKLLPSNFTEYLLSEVGFSKCEVIGSPYNPSKGFQRPIKQFTKGRIIGNETPSSINRTSNSIQPSSQLTTVTHQQEETSKLIEIQKNVTIEDVDKTKLLEESKEPLPSSPKEQDLR